MPCSSRKKIWLAASSDFAVPALTTLANHDLLAGLFTTPEKPKGRGLHKNKSFIHLKAEKCGLPVILIDNLKLEVGVLTSLKPELILTCSFGRIIPESLISLPKHGWFNIHASLLPKYRGAAPIQRAIANGDILLGITFFKIDSGIDTGPVILQKPYQRNRNQGYLLCEEALAYLAALHSVATISNILALKTNPIPQSSLTQESSFAPKLKKEEGNIDWQKSARSILDTLLAFERWPKCYSFCYDKRIIIEDAVMHDHASVNQPGSMFIYDNKLLVSCGQGTLQLLSVKREGKPKQSGISFYHGFRGKQIQFTQS